MTAATLAAQNSSALIALSYSWIWNTSFCSAPSSPNFSGINASSTLIKPPKGGCVALDNALELIQHERMLKAFLITAILCALFCILGMPFVIGYLPN